MSNDQYTSLTKSGTTIDAVFSLYLDTIESRMYVLYFSYHKPIMSTVAIASSTQNIGTLYRLSENLISYNVQITEIN
ncbi:Uncharacterized protein FWK35_00028760 [Aphis craccivora]|uniref:Uncharacterized protein n=1 Tax=Aphis craccivora TaxID=307492 RepID=A0A6G0XP54_APHCR|nr:Uncharacterized protein FWK35_00028760 [Aphis craccivora]